MYFTGRFQDMTGQGRRQSQLGFLSHKRLDEIIFQSLLQCGLFYDSM